MLDEAYEKRYLAYQSLITKPGIDPNAPIPYPSPAEWTGIPVTTSLPIPKTFADRPCGIIREIPFESIFAPAPKRATVGRNKEKKGEEKKWGQEPREEQGSEARRPSVAEPAAPPHVTRSPSPSMSGAAAASAVAITPSEKSPPRSSAGSSAAGGSVPSVSRASEPSPAAASSSAASPAGSPVPSGSWAAAVAGSPSAVAGAPSKRSPPPRRAGSAAAGSTTSPFAGANPIRKYAKRVVEWKRMQVQR